MDNLKTGNLERMGIYCFVYSVNTSLAFEENYSYTKVVTIQPQFVLVNKTKETLHFKQAEDSDSMLLEMHPNTRKEYHWTDRALSQLLQVRVKGQPMSDLVDNGTEISEDHLPSDWSQGFLIEEIGLFSLVLERRNL